MNFSLAEMHKFLSSDQYILKVNGSELKAVSRYSLWTWLAIKVFHLESYDFQRVVSIFTQNVDNYQQVESDHKSLLANKLKEKITHFNINHPERKIHISTKINELAQLAGVQKPSFTPDLQFKSEEEEVKDATKEKIENFLKERSNHYKPHQRKAILSFYDQAALQENPREAFKALVVDGITQHWGEEKAQFINQEIAILIPQNKENADAIFQQKVNQKLQADPNREKIVDFLKQRHNHYTSTQQTAILEIYDRIIQSQNPRKAFRDEVSKATPALWGPEKAQKYINREIASLIPGSDEEVSLTPLKIFQSNQFDTIAFYKNGITAFLGNFFLSKLDMKDIKNAETNPLLKQHMFDTYECAEAAFQHIKWIYISMERPGLPILSDLAMEQFRSADGEKAFQLSRALDQQFPNTYHSQWQNGLRDQVMWMILNIKFKNPALKTLLNSTGESFLIEHNNRPGKDKHWSDNHDGSGDNALGLMLMAIRAGQTQMPIVTDQHKQMNRQKLSQVNQFISQYSIF